jgi:IclR family transcriptional regulator, acetate operon repressor
VTEEDRRIAGQYTVQSVARALRLVEIVAGGPPGGLSLSELARALGASKSSTLALARTLAAFGYLRSAEPGPGYALGMSLVRLGDIVARRLSIADLCRPRIEDLAQATKMSAAVAISDEGYPVFVERVDGPGDVRFRTQLGLREPPHASAAGKAILAAMDEDGIRRLCAEAGLAPRTGRTITGIEALLDDLAQARRRGYAVTDEEYMEGVIGLAAAFSGRDGSCGGAVSVTGIKGDLPGWRVDEIGRTVRRAADDVSIMLDGSPYCGPGPAATE